MVEKNDSYSFDTFFYFVVYIVVVMLLFTTLVAYI